MARDRFRPAGAGARASGNVPGRGLRSPSRGRGARGNVLEWIPAPGRTGDGPAQMTFIRTSAPSVRAPGTSGSHTVMMR